jgi:hypothetical protein
VHCVEEVLFEILLAPSHLVLVRFVVIFFLEQTHIENQRLVVRDCSVQVLFLINGKHLHGVVALLSQRQVFSVHLVFPRRGGRERRPELIWIVTGNYLPIGVFAVRLPHNGVVKWSLLSLAVFGVLVVAEEMRDVLHACFFSWSTTWRTVGRIAWPCT